MGYFNKENFIDMLEAKADMSLGTPKQVFLSVAKMLNLLPDEDVEKVVRCKDCVKKVDYKGRVMCSKNAKVICGELCGLTATDNEHYCGYGERRTDNVDV